MILHAEAAEEKTETQETIQGFLWVVDSLSWWSC
jgi:hypothetical protein